MIRRITVMMAAAALCVCAATHAADKRPNILLLTVDDMSCDSVGAFGSRLANTTPHIDRLATQGIRFKYAHVQVGNCYPSRNVLLSGRYPHSSGVEGFFQVRNIDFPVMTDLMKAGGYFVAIRGKVSHSTPYQPYAWDADLTLVDGKPLDKKNPQSYYDSTQRGIEASREAGKPFCLSVNISDPHKPFYKGAGDRNQPTKTFSPQEVPVPGFLFDHHLVRQELARYYSTVRRADDCVGKVLKALEDSGEADSTAVMFLSDHGMPLPFAKTQLYHHSTRTPWIVRWTGMTKPGSVDEHHMISAIDALPTLLDIAGLTHPSGLEGRSFAPLLKGEKQEDRDVVFKEYNEAANRSRHPMRAAQTREYLYIFNPWSNGTRETRTATFGTATYRTMVALGKTDPNLAARERLIRLRVPEEFYDIKNDPDALKNLIDDPGHQDEISRLRKRLGDWMARTGDHALEPFLKRDDRAVVEAYMARQEKGRKPRRRAGRKNGARTR